MKKLIIAITLLITAFLIVSCNNNVQNNNNFQPKPQSIYIFNKDENLISNYIPDKKISIKSILGSEPVNKAAFITNQGKVYKSSLDKEYIDKDSNIVGVYLYNKLFSITKAYDDAKEYLKSNKKVMAILLDGFGYSQYKTAEKNAIIPFLSQYFKYEVLGVYTPVTNAGYAAIITGKTPDINGVHDRSNRQLNVPSIFDYCIKNNKKSILLEGDIKILNTEIEPVLHVDSNKNGDTDDEMYEKALEAAKGNYDLIFIHFHGIDDRGHSHGPDSEITMEYIKKIDTYLKSLSDIWEGPMIITADHGMHEIETGGGHGICRYEDMIVPYFMKE